MVLVCPLYGENLSHIRKIIRSYLGREKPLAAAGPVVDNNQTNEMHRLIERLFMIMLERAGEFIFLKREILGIESSNLFNDYRLSASIHTPSAVESLCG